jgi:putative ABC transport system permease protein
MGTFMQDVRFGARLLRRSPQFTAVALVMLALGIGANTAIFSVTNALLLRPLPYPDADRIAMIWMDNRTLGLKEDITSYPNFRDWRDQSRTFSHMAAIRPQESNLMGRGEPQRLRGAFATASFFDVLGVTPVIGRAFTAEEETLGKHTVVVISDGLWRQRFNGSRDVIGQTLTLDGTSHEVIGVMPATVDFPVRADLWRPLAPQDRMRAARGSFWLPVIGRMKPGVRVAEAQADMTALARRLEQQYPDSNTGFGAYVVPLQQQLVGRSRTVMLVLAAAVGVLLLIACVNLANLMLARGAVRVKEMALRQALGAPRWRLVRQLLTESLMLSLAGGLLGLALAGAVKDLVARLHTGTVDTLRPSEYAMRLGTIPLDGWVLAFTALVSIGVGLLFGLLPAFSSPARHLGEVLKEGGRASGQPARAHTRNLLVVSEVVLAVVLLVGAGLLVRSFWRLTEVDPGIRTAGVLTASIAMPGYRYKDRAAIVTHAERVLERVRTLPGVTAAAGTSSVFLSITPNSTVFQIEGQPMPRPGEGIEVPFDSVTSGYFETLRVPLRAGRLFTAADHAPDAARAAVVNEMMVRTFWRDGQGIGKRFNFGGTPGPDNPWITVVGVVADTKRNGLTRPVRPEIYFPYGQSPSRTLALVARTEGDPALLAPAIRRAVQELDPDQPIFNVATLDQHVAESVAQPRRSSALLGALTFLALLLASLGIYGVLSYTVAQRARELGTRVALGATSRDVFRLVVGQGLGLTVVGVAAGLPLSLLLTRFLSTLLFETTGTDPWTLGATALVMLAVAAVACYIPARRATRLDPLVALREE